MLLWGNYLFDFSLNFLDFISKFYPIKLKNNNKKNKNNKNNEWKKWKKIMKKNNEKIMKIKNIKILKKYIKKNKEK